MSRPEPGNAVYIIYGYYPGLRSPHRVFLRSLRENRSFFEKKRKPCLSPHARGFLFCVLILYGVRVFEILRFFMKTPVVDNFVDVNSEHKNAPECIFRVTQLRSLRSYIHRAWSYVTRCYHSGCLRRGYT